MIRYGNELKKIRKSKKLRQSDVAKLTTMSAYSYSSIERGMYLPDSTNVIKLLNSNFYTEKEKNTLKVLHEVAKKDYYKKIDEIKNQEMIKEKEQFRLEQLKKKRKKRKEERLIRNMPNFYEDLDKLGNLSDLDVNDTKLQDIREKVSGVRYWKGENY